MEATTRNLSEQDASKSSGETHYFLLGEYNAYCACMVLGSLNSKYRPLDFSKILDSIPAFRFPSKIDSHGYFPEGYPKILETFQDYTAFQKSIIFEDICLICN